MKTKVVYFLSSWEGNRREMFSMKDEKLLEIAENNEDMGVCSLEEFERKFNNDEIYDWDFVRFVQEEGEIEFDVTMPNFAADVFEERYMAYLIHKVEGDFENVVFHLSAPQSIYDEIDDLKEECIEIVNNE